VYDGVGCTIRFGFHLNWNLAQDDRNDPEIYTHSVLRTDLASSNHYCRPKQAGKKVEMYGGRMGHRNFC